MSANLDYTNLQVQMVKLQAKMALIDAHVDRNKAANRAPTEVPHKAARGPSLFR